MKLFAAGYAERYMSVEKNDLFRFSNPKWYNFILNNIQWIFLILFLICIGLAQSSLKSNTFRTVEVFAILYIFILILWMYLRRSFQSITINFAKREIGLKLYRKNDLTLFSFSEIDKIYLSNWLVFVINGKKKYLIGRASPDLIEKLNEIKKVEWSKFARITNDKQYKRPF